MVNFGGLSLTLKDNHGKKYLGLHLAPIALMLPCEYTELSKAKIPKPWKPCEL